MYILWSSLTWCRVVWHCTYLLDKTPHHRIHIAMWTPNHVQTHLCVQSLHFISIDVAFSYMRSHLCLQEPFIGKGVTFSTGVIFMAIGVIFICTDVSLALQTSHLCLQAHIYFHPRLIYVYRRHSCVYIYVYRHHISFYRHRIWLREWHLSIGVTFMAIGVTFVFMIHIYERPLVLYKGRWISREIIQHDLNPKTQQIW